MPCVTEVRSKKKEKRGKRQQRSALTGTGGVVGRSTAGIVGLLETWGMQVHRGINVVLLSACGCDGMRGGHVIAPTDGWRVKRQEVGCGVKGGKPMCVTGAGFILLCRNRVRNWGIRTSASTVEKVEVRIHKWMHVCVSECVSKTSKKDTN